MNKKKLPEPEIHGDKFVCPDCKRQFPSKPSFNMHWYHAHTNSFKKAKKKRAQHVIIRRKYKLKNQEVKPETKNDFLVNFCPNCGFSLNPINMAIKLMHKYDKQEETQ